MSAVAARSVPADPDTPDNPDNPDTSDGRHARRERNRLAVVDAMLSLYHEGNLEPSSDEIAARADLSPRSLFRYFDDLDDLVRVAVSRQYERVRALAELDLSTDATLAARVDRLVQQRLRLIAATSSVGRVTRLREPFQPLIAEQLTEGRRLLRAQVKRLFAPEFAAMSSGRAATALAAIDVLTSFEAVQLWRDDQTLSPAQIVATLTDSLTRLLEA